MIAAKHTPGPWTRDCGNWVYRGADFMSVRGSHFITCEVGDVSGVPHEEAFANACLIAAAPDLLAALEELLCRATDSEEERTAPWFRNAEEAIAKAKEETKSNEKKKKA